MRSIKSMMAISLLMLCASLAYAECSSDCGCMVDSAKYQALEQRVQLLEELLGAQVDDADDADSRGITDKLDDFFGELKKIRQDFFKRLSRLRADLKEHKEEIKRAKEDFDKLSALLGNPAILEKLGDGAETVFDLIVRINGRISLLEAASE